MNNAVETKPARHTPLQLQFALALYCSSYPIDVLGEMYDNPAGQEVKLWLVDSGLIEDGSGGTKWGQPTEKLRVFIEHLCAQPLPVQVWVMPKETAND